MYDEISHVLGKGSSDGRNMTKEEEFEKLKKLLEEWGIGPIENDTIRRLIEIKFDMQESANLETLDMEKFLEILTVGTEKVLEEDPDSIRKILEEMQNESEKRKEKGEDKK